MTPPESPPNDDALDDVLRAAVTALRTPVAARPEVVQAVKAAVRQREHVGSAASAIRSRQRLSFFTAPRTVRMSLITALAAMLAVVAGVSSVTVSLMRRSTALSARSAIAAGNSRQPTIQFTISAPDAQAVSLVGDFNDWNPAATALQQRDGTWSVSITVPPGRHQYAFVVDGSRWITDPAAPESPESDYGTANSVVYVGS
jgi:Glycogen recognition site of AMP-activated protein kinase